MAIDTNTSSSTSVKRVIVQYRTKADQADANQELVEAVFASLNRDLPDWLRYATFRLGDGVSFVHVASIETEDGTNPLQSVEEFAAFSREIADRCETPPEAQGATLIGSYRFLDDGGTSSGHAKSSVL